MVQTSAEKIEQTGPAKRKEWLSATKKAVGKYARAALAKEKKNIDISPDQQMVIGAEA